MFCLFGDRYAQAIGGLASSRETRGTVVSELVLQTVVVLQNAGALVAGIVCDGVATNRQMWTHKGASGKLDK